MTTPVGMVVMGNSVRLLSVCQLFLGDMV
jgi:hypothetical protein